MLLNELHTLSHHLRLLLDNYSANKITMFMKGTMNALKSVLLVGDTATLSPVQSRQVG